jgi:hypothetical protein
MYPKGDAAIVVNAKLRTRVANSDAPFAIAFDDVTSLLDALEQAITNRTPLWHLALLNPTMTKIRRLGEGYMLFGAYPGDRSDEVEEVIGRIIKENKGIALSTSMTHRVWTERFFPVAPSRVTPDVDRDLMPLSKLASTLSETKNRSDLAIQANVARSNEALLLTLHSES